jgi:Helix-turn-helix domain
MAARRKLGPVEVERLVAARASGRSLRQIAQSLGVDHSTLSRRIASDPVVRARIGEAEKREARRARDRERKRRAKARREAALAQSGATATGRDAGSAPEQEQPFAVAPAPEDGHDRSEQGSAAGAAGRRGVRTRPHGRRDELRLARRILHDRSASVEARLLALEKLGALLHATRTNGQPAYSLRLGAVAAILKNPDYVDLFAPASGSSGRRRRRR